MPALIDDYTYDIFISYRQNDNRYDGWVSDFVTNLHKELEATLKEKLTIFFDENPVDGLLETHSVEKSLSDKLKCLIFIPIISQTYCDSKSYAWEYEFREFNRFARNDRFGRNIRLAGGNVASRILAVRIHDLDPDDLMTIENEIGENLRSIDFIYRSSGVNRPLRSNEDHPGSNLNKTFYRDQINKVANAVKEIIHVLKKQNYEEPIVLPEKSAKRNSGEGHFVQYKKRYIAGIIISLVVLCIIYFSSGSYRSTVSLEKSIAVLPFRNNSPGDSNTYFINGVMEEVLNNLQKIKDVRIISRTSVEQYRNSTKSIPQISKELGVNYIVEGSGQRYGNSFRINIQLIRGRKETYLWSKSYDQLITSPYDIINIQSAIAQSIVSELEGNITPREKQLIEKIPTTNLTAYDFYQKGKEELSKFWIDITDKQALSKADKLFKKALEYDPKFAEAIVGQAEVYWNYRHYLDKNNVMDSVFLLTDIALSLDDKIAQAYVIKGWCYDEEGLADKAREQYIKAIRLRPNDWKAYFSMAELYDFEDPVKSLSNLRKSASLTHGAVEMPTLLRHIGGELLVTGYFEKANEYFTKAFELDGDTAIYLSCLGGIEHNRGNYEKALSLYKEAYKAKRNYFEVIHDLALFSQLTGRDEDALKYYRELESHNEMNSNEHRMGYTLWKNGFYDEANKYINRHLEKCLSFPQKGARADQIVNTNYDLAGIYAFKGDKEKAFIYLRLFNQTRNCFTFMINLIKNDPLFDTIRDEPEFLRIIADMELKYDKVHADVGKWISDQEEF
jgi:TolB-like protein/Tfp pilus assembly protein PilF